MGLYRCCKPRNATGSARFKQNPGAESLWGVALCLYIRDDLVDNGHELLQKLFALASGLWLRQLVVIRTASAPKDGEAYGMARQMWDTLNTNGNQCDKLEYRLFSNGSPEQSGEWNDGRCVVTVRTHWALPGVHHWTSKHPWRNQASFETA